VRRAAAAGSVLLLLGGVGFFYECVRMLAARDYVAGILVMFVGFAVMRGGSDLARLALGAGRP
jgi:hypothetical protein